MKTPAQTRIDDLTFLADEVEEFFNAKEELQPIRQLINVLAMNVAFERSDEDVNRLADYIQERIGTIIEKKQSV